MCKRETKRGLPLSIPRLPNCAKRQSVAQVSKPAVSPISKSAARGNVERVGFVERLAGWETRDTADEDACATV
jgi:hypothetical protein